MSEVKKYSVVSIALIGISVLVALMSSLGDDFAALHLWLIAEPNSNGLENITNGQLWRLLTPIFIHFGPIHLLFNMIWIWDLGKVIESRKGVGFYIAFVLIAGVVSNLAQYLFTHAPEFGGMSGVLYGMFGYLWMQGRFNPRFGFALEQNVVIMMLVWYALCWTGFLGPIANWAHTAGLLVGVIWGYPTKKVS
ncbi:MAG: rhomboid family intramembrane serine protease [Pseudomonadota bacterium]